MENLRRIDDEFIEEYAKEFIKTFKCTHCGLRFESVTGNCPGCDKVCFEEKLLML